MKKLYTTLALAAAVALGASAATDAAKERKISDKIFTTADIENVAVNPAPVKLKKVNGPQKAPTTIDELCGMYTGVYYGYFESNQGENEMGFTILPGEGANNIIITTWWTGKDLEATVDFTTKQISIPEQVVYNDSSYGAISFTAVLVTADSKVVFANKPFILNILEDGSLQSPVIKESNDLLSQTGFGFGKSGLGFFDAGYNMTVEPYVIPDFDLTGWTKVGTAKYHDNGWVLQGIFGFDGAEDLPFQDVEYYTKEEFNEIDEEMHTLIALYQPYSWYNAWGEATYSDWAESGAANESETTGAIVIDVTFPQAVIVNQGNYCGFKNDGDYYWPWNQEYMEFYINGFDADDIAEGLDEVSTFNENDNVIEITNCYFGLNANPSASYHWGKYDENDEFIPNPTLVLVQLDENFSSINTIVTDNNAPVEYYNLQGQRVSENAKGLVIRKQGNTAVKIVR